MLRSLSEEPSDTLELQTPPEAAEPVETAAGGVGHPDGRGPVAQSRTEARPAATDLPRPETAALQPWPKLKRTLSLRVSDSSPLLSPDSGDRLAAEQYRMLRTRILQHPAAPSMIVVSSPGSGDGKTVTAINLAGTLALKGEGRVLLVDGDLRRSAIHTCLLAPRSPGLAEVLAGDCTLEEALLEVEELPSLSILPAGKTVGNPAELLDSSSWVSLAGQLREQFARIVIDSPPVQAVADYDLMASVADGILLVVRPDHTNRRQAKIALGKVKQKLLGVLINDAADWFLWKQYSSGYAYYRHAEDAAKVNRRVKRRSATMRRVAQWLWVNLLAASGSLRWARHQMRRRGAVIVLTFHRVLDDAGYRATDSLAGIIVRRQTFEKLAAYVAERYEAVDVGAAKPGESCRRLRVAFTFDDGWSDNYAFAFPIAQAHGIPLTVFLCPALAGRRAPFWPERVAALLGTIKRHGEIEATIEELKHCAPEERERRIERLGAAGVTAPFQPGDSTLSWEAIIAMDRGGVRFGSHTYTHQILTTVPADVVRREVRESKDAIEQALGHPCDLFAYPNGDWSPEIRAMLAESGYRLAFTTKRGAWTAASDRLAIPRLNVYEGNLAGLTGRFSPAMFEYTIFWKAWRAMKGDGLKARARRQPATAAV